MNTGSFSQYKRFSASAVTLATLRMTISSAIGEVAKYSCLSQGQTDNNL